MNRQNQISLSVLNWKRSSICNGEEFLLIRAPRLYEEIQSAIKIGRQHPLATRRNQPISRSKCNAIAFAKRLLQSGWRASRLGLLKSRVAVLMPIRSKRYVLDSLAGKMAAAYRADTIDVGVIISTSSNRVTRGPTLNNLPPATD